MQIPATPVFDSWRSTVNSKLWGFRSHRQLQHWLEGYDLPPIDSYTEAHSWLLIAINDQPSLKTKLIAPVVKLLRACAKGDLKSSNLERLLFNLFYLCRHLRDAPLLWGPLNQVLEAEAAPARTGWGLRERRYHDISLITAFRSALTENQGDWRLEPVWRRMLTNQPDEILQGTPMDGFEGILGLPGNPNEFLMGWALARMTDYLDNSPFREEQFRELLRMLRARLDVQDWDFEVLALSCGLRRWSYESVGDPIGRVTIEYADVPRVEYMEAGKRAVVRLPLKYQSLASKVEPIIRQMVTDFQMVNLPDEYLRAGIQSAVPSLTKKLLPSSPNAPPNDASTEHLIASLPATYLTSKIEACLR